MIIRLDNIGESLRNIRGTRTLSEFARIMKRSISHISLLESGGRTPSLDTLLNYSRAMVRGQRIELIIEKDMVVDLKVKHDTKPVF